MRATKLLICAVAALAGACASGGSTRATAQEAGQSQQPAQDQPATQQGGGLVPPGFGTLKQDQFTVSLRSGALLVKVTPLTESVIRLAAPDTYNRLHALAESRRADATRRVPGELEMFLVSFFSYQPDVTFQPELLQLTSQGRLMRPAAILPMSAGWGAQRLGQQEVQTAVYVFEGRIDYGQALVVRYEMLESEGWSGIVPLLDQERAKAQVRATNGG